MTAPHITDFAAIPSEIEGLTVFTMKQVSDARGTVREFYRASTYEAPLAAALGEGFSWHQVNVTETGHGAVRGLHGEAMTKLVACVSGTAFGVYLDAREDSATFGRVLTVDLVPGAQVLVPAGVCNAFQSVSPGGTQYLYCFTAEWQPGMAGTAFTPLDDALGVTWPVPLDPSNPAQVSAKDVGAPKFSEVHPGVLQVGA